MNKQIWGLWAVSFSLSISIPTTTFAAAADEIPPVSGTECGYAYIETFAGTGRLGTSGDGMPADEAPLSFPQAVEVDAEGNVYLTDYGNAQVRMIDPTGTIRTIAGTGVEGYSGDGGPATDARISRSVGISVDEQGYIYIADTFNNMIRRVDPSGIIIRVAGRGERGYTGEASRAVNAMLNRPSFLTCNSEGDVYFSDTDNSVVRVIRSSKIFTVAGTGNSGYRGDGGPATEAWLSNPGGLCFDAAGNLYVADTDTHVVRKIDSDGIITTVAGTGEFGYSGDGGPATLAQLHNPSGLATDSAGNLYIGDSANHVIRVVDTSGMIETIAGTGNTGYSGDGGPPEEATMTNLGGLAIDTNGWVYIVDINNHAIRRIVRYQPVQASAGDDQTMLLGESLNLIGQAGGGDGSYVVSWEIEAGPSTDSGQLTATAESETLFTPAAPGEYTLKFTVDDELQEAVSDSIAVTVYAPIEADAGRNQSTFAGNSVTLHGQATGGNEPYDYTWSVVSGPDRSPSQFSDTASTDSSFTPSTAGAYVLQLTVDDGDQAPVADTITVLAISVNSLHSVVVTDSLDEGFSDLSNQEDSDTEGAQSLVIRWHFDETKVDVADITDVHVYVRINQTGSFAFLGRTGSGTVDYLDWSADNRRLLASQFRDGPEFGQRYEFRVYAVTRSGTPLFYGPFGNAGPILLIEDQTEPAPVPTDTPTPMAPSTSTPTNTPEPEATPTPVAEPTDTPIPANTATEEPEPTSTPTATEGPTNTPSNTPTVAPTNTPTETPIPTATNTPTPPPDTIPMVGAVRDFYANHPDFERYTSNRGEKGIVDTTLGPDRKPVYNTSASHRQVTSAETFAQWYNDVPGVNQSTPYEIVLQRDPDSPLDSPVYTFESRSFFPIDGQIFGNQGRNHNFHFTFELHTEFTYTGPQDFHFSGDDDVWVFINNELVIDLGGVHPRLSASINTGDLGLVEGETYPLDFFFAERHTTGSNFIMTSGIVLTAVPPTPTPTATNTATATPTHTPTDPEAPTNTPEPTETPTPEPIPGPDLYLEPLVLDFILETEDPNGNVNSGHSTASVIIYNRGTTTGRISSLSLDQATSWIRWAPRAPIRVAPGESEELTVFVNWAQVPVGEYTRRLLVESDDFAESPYPDGVMIHVNRLVVTPTPVPTDTPTEVEQPTDTPTPSSEEPTATPTDEPGPEATNTPVLEPTDTPAEVPTATPVTVPTDTPEPSATDTPEPTPEEEDETPTPTATSVAESTATPLPDEAVIAVDPQELGFYYADGDTELSFEIENRGEIPLEISSIAPDRAAAWIAVSEEAPFEVPAGESVVVTVTVDWDLAPTWDAGRVLLIGSNDTDNNPFRLTVNVTKHGEAAATLTPTPEDEATPTPTSPDSAPTNTPVTEPTATPVPEPTDTPEPTAVPEPTNTATPVSTPTFTATPVDTPTPTLTPTATATPRRHWLFTFDPMTETPESLDFPVVPESVDARIAGIPVDIRKAEATNGIGMQILAEPGDFVTSTGPTLPIGDEPVTIGVWFRTPDPWLQFGLGAYADIEGQPGTVSYTMCSEPEVAANTWQHAEIEIEAGYTQIVPFIALFNSSESDVGVLYVDNLAVDLGEAADKGDAAEAVEWQPNLWLSDMESGTAYPQGNDLILVRENSDKASRMMAVLEPESYPVRISVEVDVIKKEGESSTFSLWIGNGPSAFQTDVPLWILSQGQQHTVKLSGVTLRNSSGAMYVATQLSGGSDESAQVVLRNVRIYQNDGP